MGLLVVKLFLRRTVRTQTFMLAAATTLLHIARTITLPRYQSDTVVAALREAGVPVVYAVDPDERRSLLRPANSFSSWAIGEQLLARCLGGGAADAVSGLRRTILVLEDSTFKDGTPKCRVLGDGARFLRLRLSPVSRSGRRLPRPCVHEPRSCRFVTTGSIRFSRRLNWAILGFRRRIPSVSKTLADASMV